MSLRTDIHDAIDEVATSAPMLARQVEAFVLTEAEQRGKSSNGRRWTMRWGAGAAMVAAILVVVLVGTILVGGFRWRQWNEYQYQQGINATVATPTGRPLGSLPTV